MNGDDIFDITPADCRRYHQLMAGEELDLAQFAITLQRVSLPSRSGGFGDRAIVKINPRDELAAQLGARKHFYYVPVV
ncbi:MAG: hypothetical protein R2867_33890 [Caldilineaceae bacterium]